MGRGRECEYECEYECEFECDWNLLKLTLKLKLLTHLQPIGESNPCFENENLAS